MPSEASKRLSLSEEARIRPECDDRIQTLPVLSCSVAPCSIFPVPRYGTNVKEYLPTMPGSALCGASAINRAAIKQRHPCAFNGLTREAATSRGLSNASVRRALIAVAVPASFALTGCAAIDDLKDAISRWLDTASFQGGREALPEEWPNAIPILQRRKSRRGSQAKRQRERIGRRAMCSGCRLPRLQTTHRTPVQLRRTSRRKCNPRRRRLCDCALCIPRAPAPGVFSR